MGAEEKFVDLLLTQNHLLLAAGVFAIIQMARWVPQVRDTVFTEKWKWTIAIINLALSSAGVFLAKLTDFTTIGPKIALVCIISMTVTFTYEAVGKYAIDFLVKKIKKIFGAADADPPVTPPVAPAP